MRDTKSGHTAGFTERREGGTGRAIEVGTTKPFTMFYQTDQPLTATLTTTEELTDEQLMAGIQGGDEVALAALHRRHMPLLRTVISRVLHNDHDVDDLVQEVFIELWNRAASYDEAKGKALGWMVTLAR